MPEPHACSYAPNGFLETSGPCLNPGHPEPEKTAASGRPAKVELMGYRQHIGRVREVTVAGAQMLALAAVDGAEIVFPAGSVYCITWLAEESLTAARRPRELPAAGQCTCQVDGYEFAPGCPVHGEDVE